MITLCGFCTDRINPDEASMCGGEDHCASCRGDCEVCRAAMDRYWEPAEWDDPSEVAS